MMNQEGGRNVMHSPKDLLKLQLIEQWDHTNVCLIEYQKMEIRGIDPNRALFMCNVRGLWRFMKPSMLREDALRVDDVEKKLKTSNVQKYIELFDDFTDWLYGKKALKWDDGNDYDRSHVEEANRQHGL